MPCSGFGGNPGLCAGSENGGNFIFPNAYNLPCSAPNVITLAPLTPGLAPGLAPSLAPALSPVAEVPVTSPSAASIAELGLPSGSPSLSALPPAYKFVFLPDP